MAPAHRRGPWVPEEDHALLQLVRSQGPNNWVRISQHMHFRSPKQCRERFHQNLKPSLNHEPISADEGVMIERMVGEMGKRWAEIARRLGNRSDNAVKNWWNGSMNRKRRGSVLPTTTTAHQSRTFNGRIEPPYPKASAAHHSRLSSLESATRRSSWAASTETVYSERPSLSYSPPYASMNQARRLSSSANSEYEEPVSGASHTTAKHLAPIFALPYQAVDGPMTSPAFSEASSAGTPSMISDRTSNYSVSPRTALSPQLLPQPIDVRHSYADLRRGSVPNLKPTAPLSPADSYYPTTPFGPSLSRWGGPLRAESPPPGPSYYSSTAEPARDSRMGVNSLLN